MSQVVRAADELEALRQLKARYCRFLDTKDVESWRAVFTADLVVTLDMAVSVGDADPMTAPPIEGVDNFVPMVLGGLEGVATMHHCHTPELTLTSAATATGIWAMEDLLVFADGRAGEAELLGADRRHDGAVGGHVVKGRAGGARGQRQRLQRPASAGPRQPGGRARPDRADRDETAAGGADGVHRPVPGSVERTRPGAGRATPAPQARRVPGGRDRARQLRYRPRAQVERDRPAPKPTVP